MAIISRPAERARKVQLMADLNVTSSTHLKSLKDPGRLRLWLAVRKAKNQLSKLKPKTPV